MSARLLMVMPYVQLVRKAREEGFWVCAVWDPALREATYRSGVAAVADAYLEVDFSDHAALRRTLHDAARQYRIDHIVHVGREDSMLATYEIAEELGLALNPSRAIRLLNDKLAMRELLRTRGMSTVEYGAARERAGVRSVLDGFRLPVVVKPTTLAGSRGVYLLRAVAELPEWERLIDSYRYSGPFLVEEYLRGPEFSVETLSHDGHHEVIGITAKRLTPPPLFVELGHLHPAPLPAERAQAIRDLVVGLLTACGYRSGPAHTEVIWTAAGPKLVESQARLGGDRIPRLVELASGVDLERAMFAALAGRPQAYVPATRSAMISYFRLPPGPLGVLPGAAGIPALDYVDDFDLPLRPGDIVPETRDSKSRHGHVIVTGESADEVRARADDVEKMLRINGCCTPRQYEREVDQ